MTEVYGSHEERSTCHPLFSFISNSKGKIYNCYSCKRFSPPPNPTFDEEQRYLYIKDDLKQCGCELISQPTALYYALKEKSATQDNVFVRCLLCNQDYPLERYSSILSNGYCFRFTCNCI